MSYPQIKRLIDIALASLGLILLAPVFFLVAFLVWLLISRNSVVFRQTRPGLRGVPFTCYKFTSMQEMSSDYITHDASWRHGQKRIPPFGALIRSLGLDELPQLLNVIRGDMSLIGPRPERPEFDRKLEKEIPHYRLRHCMQPGLSGWAQVCAPYASSIEDSDLKLSYDLYYMRHFSTWLDLVILFRTIKTVLKAGGR